MPKMFGVLPCRLPSCAYAPGRDRIFQMRDRRERLAGEADIQRVLSGLDEATKRGIESGVVTIVRSTAIWGCAGDLTGGDDGFGQVVVDMGVNASKRKLDSRDRALAAAIEQTLPASRRCLAGE